MKFNKIFTLLMLFGLLISTISTNAQSTNSENVELQTDISGVKHLTEAPNDFDDYGFADGCGPELYYYIKDYTGKGYYGYFAAHCTGLTAYNSVPAFIESPFDDHYSFISYLSIDIYEVQDRSDKDKLLFVGENEDCRDRDMVNDELSWNTVFKSPLFEQVHINVAGNSAFKGEIVILEKPNIIQGINSIQDFEIPMNYGQTGIENKTAITYLSQPGIANKDGFENNVLGGNISKLSQIRGIQDITTGLITTWTSTAEASIEDQRTDELKMNLCNGLKDGTNITTPSQNMFKGYMAFNARISSDFIGQSLYDRDESAQLSEEESQSFSIVLESLTTSIEPIHYINNSCAYSSFTDNSKIGVSNSGLNLVS